MTHVDDEELRHVPATKKLLLIGSVSCGKTTFLQRLQGIDQSYSKTQTIYTREGVYDTPGEYIDSVFFKPALNQASMNVDLVVFLHSATVSMQKIPPMFSTFFVKPTIGIVTKIDIATDDQIAHARRLLELTGAPKVFAVSSLTCEGFDELMPYLT